VLHDLVSGIELALGHKIFALGVYLDVEEAFDNTFFEAMRKATTDHEVHFTISRWIAVMLSNRMVRAEISSVNSTMMVLKNDRENMETETKGCVLGTHYGVETHFDLRCFTVVEKSITNKCQSKNSTPATPCLCKHNREHAFYSNCSSGDHTDVGIPWYLY
jgi:hypothetical protein